MTQHSTAADLDADPSCTLPTADRPIRAAGFEQLLGASLRAGPVAPLAVAFQFPPGPETASAAAHLVSREVQCCSFFRFRLDITQDSTELTVGVPPGHERALAGLLRLAAP